jgi:hypothetical protein
LPRFRTARVEFTDQPGRSRHFDRVSVSVQPAGNAERGTDNCLKNRSRPCIASISCGGSSLMT